MREQELGIDTEVERIKLVDPKVTQGMFDIVGNTLEEVTPCSVQRSDWELEIWERVVSSGGTPIPTLKEHSGVGFFMADFRLDRSEEEEIVEGMDPIAAELIRIKRDRARNPLSDARLHRLFSSCEVPSMMEFQERDPRNNALGVEVKQ